MCTVDAEDFEDELDENVSQEPVKPSSADETAPKKVIGRPITKETAKQYQLSAARAKRQRKIARARMLDALCNQLDLGDEMVKAVKAHDEAQIRLIERAVQIVGLHHDQSCEAQAQKLEIKSDNKVDSKLEIVVKDA